MQLMLSLRRRTKRRRREEREQVSWQAPQTKLGEATKIAVEAGDEQGGYADEELLHSRCARGPGAKEYQVVWSREKPPGREPSDGGSGLGRLSN